MHRERGFNRFFVLYALFVLGMEITALAGTIETLFAGWEFVGLSSALLVAFFHERRPGAKRTMGVDDLPCFGCLTLAGVGRHARASRRG